jgi:hypothetical protein
VTSCGEEQQQQQQQLEQQQQQEHSHGEVVLNWGISFTYNAVSHKAAM